MILTKLFPWSGRGERQISWFKRDGEQKNQGINNSFEKFCYKGEKKIAEYFKDVGNIFQDRRFYGMFVS